MKGTDGQREIDFGAAESQIGKRKKTFVCPGCGARVRESAVAAHKKTCLAITKLSGPK